MPTCKRRSFTKPRVRATGQGSGFSFLDQLGTKLYNDNNKKQQTFIWLALSSQVFWELAVAGGDSWPRIGDLLAISIFFSISDMTNLSFSKATGHRTKLFRGRPSTVNLPDVPLGKIVTRTQLATRVFHLPLQQICDFDAHTHTVLFSAGQFLPGWYHTNPTNSSFPP